MYQSDLGGKTLTQEIAQATRCAYSTKSVNRPTLQEVRSIHGSKHRHAECPAVGKNFSLQENQTFLYQAVKRKRIYPRPLQSAHIPNKRNFSYRKEKIPEFKS